MAKDKDRPLSALDRAIQQAIGEGREVGCPDDPARERWPSLWEWMTRIHATRDHVMQPASLSIRMIGGGVSVSCSNRDLATSVSTVCPFLGDALDEIEKVLANPSVITASWGRKEAQLRKRRPRS